MRVVTTLPLSDWRKAAEAARSAEAAGFDIVQSLELGNDPFAPLVAASLGTERIELTTSIAVAFPRSPTVMAAQAWDLQANSRGRFSLGIGSQVRGHNERRFGVAWSAPAPRLRDYVRAMRAVWRTWETGEKLSFQSDHYKLSLMTPDFSPKPSGLAMVPVSVAAVGGAMLRVAGEVCDGVRLHPIATRRYVEEIALPAIEHGMRRSGRSRSAFEIHGGGFVATGADEADVAKSIEWVRSRVAFYASTPAYRPILALHGLEDLHERLYRMSVDRRWREMPAEVPDDFVRTVAACGTYREIVPAIRERFAGVADTVEINFPADAPADAVADIVTAVQAIPHTFKGFGSAW